MFQGMSAKDAFGRDAFGQSGLDLTRLHGRMTMRSGGRSRTCWVAKRLMLSPCSARPVTWPSCPPPSGAWASCMRSASLPQPTRWHGRMHCLCCQQWCPEMVERCLRELQAGSQAAAPSLQAAAAEACTVTAEDGKRACEQRRIQRR